MPTGPAEAPSVRTPLWRSAARHAAVGAGFLALAVWFTWPLAAHLDTHVPGPTAGDNLTFVWNLWWMRQTLASGVLSFFRTDALFYPFGTGLILHTHTALNALVAATALRGLSVVTAQDLLLIGAIATNSFAAYLLAWDVTRRRLGSIVAGLCFGSAPYFAAHAEGHFNLTSAWTLPIFALCWLRALRRRGWPSAVGAGLMAVLTAYTDYYYVLYLGVFVGCTLAGRWIRMTWSRPAAPSAAARVLVAASAICLVGALAITLSGGGVVHLAGWRISATSGRNLFAAAWLLVASALCVGAARCARVSLSRAGTIARDTPYLAIVLALLAAGAFPLWRDALVLWRHGDYASQAYFWRSSPGGVDLATLVLGNPYHGWWAPWVQRMDAALRIDPMESTAWLGIGPLVLLAATWRSWWTRPHARLWLLIAAVFFVWALGPDLRVFGLRTGLYLPAALLRFAPIAANARIPGRAMVMVYLALAVLVAIALDAQPRRRLGFALAALVAIEGFPGGLPIFAPDRPPIYTSLARMPPGGLLEIPLGVRDGFGELGRFDSRVMYYQTLHGKPMVGGFVARLSPALRAHYRESPALRVLLDLSAGTHVDAATLTAARQTVCRFLDDSGVRYIVVNTRTTPKALSDFVVSLPIALADTDADHRLYRVTTIDSAF